MADLEGAGTGPRNAGDEGGGANRSYTGYEYQIVATVWIALDLMLARKASRALVIEPRSQEDVEARVSSPGADDEGVRLTIQVKSRSTGPWSTADFAEVLTGRRSAGSTAAPSGIEGPRRKRRGPPPRRRPIEMLGADPDLRYIFVTDAAVDSGLSKFCVATVDAHGSARRLPAAAAGGMGGAAELDLAGRITILQSVDVERLRARIEKHLRLHGHVPTASCERCASALCETVRARLVGATRTPLRRDEVIGVIQTHGGSLQPTRALDGYVEPRSFAAIERTLRTRHAVIIAGPSGTGKTMTADILEERLRHDGTGYEVVGSEDGPGLVGRMLRAPHPVLFHLKDPWGSIRFLPSSRPWHNELAKLIRSSGPDKKFLITTRTDVLREAGPAARHLRSLIVNIEVEDYDEGSRQRIFDHLLARLAGDARRFGNRARARAVEELSRPFEIDRFFAEIDRADDLSPSRLDEFLRASQIDAIANVVAERILAGDHDKDIAAAAVVWGLTTALTEVPSAMFATLRRGMTAADRSFQAEIETFVEVMVAGRNLRLSAGRISWVHPQVDNGFRMAILARPAATEGTLGLLVRALVGMDGGDVGRGVDDWGAETANRLRRAMLEFGDALRLDLDERFVAALDRQLVGGALRSGAAAFPRAFDDLAQLAGAGSLPGRMARMLLGKSRRLRTRSRSLGWGTFWRLPKDGMTAAGVFGADPTCVELVGRFVTDALPVRPTWYDDTVFVAFVLAISPHADRAFLDAVRSNHASQRPTTNNLRVLVAGALAGMHPPYDALIEGFLERERRADLWLREQEDELREAREGILDAGYANHVQERAGEEHLESDTGLLVSIRMRREREGHAWMLEHPGGERLLRHWTAVLADGKSRPADWQEIAILLDRVRSDAERGDVWRAVATRPQPEAIDVLRAEMTDPGHDGALRVGWLHAFAAIEGRDWMPTLAAYAATSRFDDVRRLELVLDVSRLRLAREIVADEAIPNPSRSQDWLFATWGEPVRGLAEYIVRVARSDGESQGTAGPPPSPAAMSLGVPVLDRAAPDLVALLLRSLPTTSATLHAEEGFLGGDDPVLCCSAVTAIARSADPKAVALLTAALSHAHWSVRESAVRSLPAIVTGTERSNLVVAMGVERSSLVLLAFARAMGGCLWHEGRDLLCHLLAHDRDFEDMPGGSIDHGARYEVARAAAEALGWFPVLDDAHLTAILGHAFGESRDEEVASGAWNAIIHRPSVLIDHWLMTDASTIDLVSSEFAERGRPPTGWAALRALADRAVAGVLRTRSPRTPWLSNASTGIVDDLAAPAILVMAAVGADNEIMDLLDAPEEAFPSVRKALLLAALRMHGSPMPRKRLEAWLGRTDDHIGRFAQALGVSASASGPRGTSRGVGMDEAKALEWIEENDPSGPIGVVLRDLIRLTPRSGSSPGFGDRDATDVVSG